jgi:hypothetical protein
MAGKYTTLSSRQTPWQKAEVSTENLGGKKRQYIVSMGVRGNPAIVEGTMYHEVGHIVDAEKRKQGQPKIQRHRSREANELEGEKRANEYARPFINAMPPFAQRQAKWDRRAAVQTYINELPSKKKEIVRAVAKSYESGAIFRTPWGGETVGSLGRRVKKNDRY